MLPPKVFDKIEFRLLNHLLTVITIIQCRILNKSRIGFFENRYILIQIIRPRHMLGLVYKALILDILVKADPGLIIT